MTRHELRNLMRELNEAALRVEAEIGFGSPDLDVCTDRLGRIVAISREISIAKEELGWKTLLRD